MLRRFFYLFALICMLASLAVPAPARAQHSAAPAALPTATPTAQPGLTAQLGEGIDPRQISPAAPLVIVFSQAMDTASATPALLTFPYQAGTETWDSQAKVLTFQAEGGLPGGKAVQVYLNSDLRAKSGDAFKTLQQWTLNVQGAPRLVSFDPPAKELGLRLPTITLEFDREMNLDSLKQAIQIEPAAAFALKAAGKKVDVSFTQPFEPGAQFKLNLTTAAQDKAGAALDRPYSQSYRVRPFELSNLICEQKRITFDSSYAIPQTDFRDYLVLDPPVAGEWFSLPGDMSFAFNPAQDLAWAQPYTVQFKSGLMGSEKLSLPASSAATCTVEPPFSVTPKQSNIENGDEIKQVKITFQVPMDETSVKQAFKIEPETPGELTFSSPASSWDQLIFTPERPFLSGAYTVTLDSAMRTKDNRLILAKPYQWQFSVPQYWGYFTKTAAFTDHGPNIQVVDADAPRYLQIVSHAGQQKLYFDAYALDLPTFVQRYRTAFAYVSSNGSAAVQKIDTSGLERVKEFSFSTAEGISDLLLPSDLPNGLYVLNMRGEKSVLDQIFLVLSHNTIAAKLSGSRLFAWTTNINGKSAGPVEMRLYTQTGELMREGKANDEGIYETNRPYDSTPMLVAARDQEGDITLAGLTDPWISPSSYNSYDYYWYASNYSADPTPNLMAYIFTDRPIYRPGNRVHYKVILRNDNDMRYTSLTSEQAVTVRLRDARDNLLEEREQRSNAFGTLNGDFSLPAEGNLGDYHIEVTGLGDTVKQHFTVQEYHKPDYSVTLQTSGKTFVDGETVNLNVEARYFLGQPMANADVTLKFFQYYDKPVTVSGKTDANGRYSYDAIANLRAAMPYYYGDYEVAYSWGSSLQSAMQRVEVTVSDGSNQPVSASAAFQVYNAAQGLTLDTHGYFKTPGKPFNVDVSAVTYDGKPVANQAVQLTVYGSDQNSWDKEIATYEAVTGADGKAVVEVQLEKTDDYKLVVMSADSSGKAVYNSEWVTAYAPNRAWDFGQRDEFSIHADKGSYPAYTKGKLLIRSTFSGPALLTFERGSVLHSQLVTLTTPMTEIETDIIPEYAPNVFVTVNAWQDQPYQPYQPEAQDYYQISANRPNSRLRLDTVELKVDAVEKPLSVSVTSDKTSYAPREQAAFTIQVSGANGPVQAELAVGLVDEAIYSLKSEPWKAIYDAFYARRPHTIANYDSLAPRRYLIEEGGRGGGGEPSPNLESPRANFPDTAVWLPAVVTDAQGKAVVSLSLPDTLTRWRLTVRAVTRDTHVGETTYSVQTEQAIALRPAFPSVITAGDQLELAAYVHNTGSTPQTLTAALSAPGLTLVSGASQTVEVKPGEAKPLLWQVKAETPGTVQVTVQAVGGSQGDAIQIPISVQPRATLSVDQRSGDFSGKLDLPVFLPPSALDNSSLRLELSRSLAGDALSGLESLIGYPYGCVEQTMSKALPNAVVGRALKRLGLSRPELDQQLPELIDAGVKKLYGMQHYDGGWGWWTDDATDDYQTAWVVFGLAMTRDAGYPVDAQVIQRGADYLRKSLKLPTTHGNSGYGYGYSRESQEELDARLKAFMLYSLAQAGQGDKELALSLYQNAAALDAFSQSALALALHKHGLEKEAGQLVQDLESTAFQSQGMAYWPGMNQDGEYHRKTMSSEVRTAALALEAIQTIRPESKLTGEIVRYLMAHKTASGWGSTNETAFTLLALTGQLEALKDVTGPTGYQVLVNGKAVSQVAWKTEDLNTVVELPRKDLAQGLNRLEIIPDNEAALFYTLAVRLYSDAAGAQPSGSLTIQRDYLDPKTGTALTRFEAGQIVKVRLVLGKGERAVPYVMVEDHLPGGLEALNEGLNTASREFNQQYLYYYGNYYDGMTDEFSPWRWQEWGYNNKEIHDGRVNFFITSLDKNGRTLTYYARALRPGDFTALPAEVSAMYNPELWGRTDTAVIEIR